MQRIADRYDLLSRLGQGGMAEVWLGHDLRLDREVAVKLLHRYDLHDGRAAERFTREVRVVGRLSHPNIVSAFDAGTHDGRPFLVMELVDGTSLAERIADGPLPLAGALDIAAQVCAALAAAHEAQVVHRDIKPSNVLVTSSGLVKVLDFGIAALVDAEDSRLTRTSTIVGTGGYLAPERITGRGADPRSDLYSLGCLLYAMLTGEPPFGAEDPVGVLYQHMHATPRPLPEVRADVPADVADLAANLLAKDATDRPRSAAAVATPLRAFAQRYRTSGPAPSGPTATMVLPAASAPSPGPAPARRPRPSRQVVIAAAILLAGLVLVLLLLLLPNGSREQGRSDDTSAPRAEPTTTAPTEESTPTPQVSGTGPASRIDQLRAVIDGQTGAGGIDGDAAEKLRDDLTTVEDEHDAGDAQEAANQVARLRSRLDDLDREGEVTTTAYRALDAAATRLASSLPTPTGEDGDDGEDGDGRGNGRGEGGNGHDNGDGGGNGRGEGND